MTQESIPYAGISASALDASHLQTIAICHYVWGAITMLLSCFGLFYVFLGYLFLSGKMPSQPGQPPTPPQLGMIFIVMGAMITLLGWTVAILTIVSGRYIAQRRRRIFSLVMAGINCAAFPFGTLLGVFTFIVLLRNSVHDAYERPA